MGGGFPHRARRYQPGGSLFSSAGCSIRRCVEGHPIRGWFSILPGYGRTSTLTREATFRAHLLYGHAPIRDQPIGGGVSTPCRAVSTPGITFSVCGLLELKVNKRIYYYYDQGMGYYRPWVRLNLDVGTRGNSRRALALKNPANRRSADGAGISELRGAVWTRWYRPEGSLFFGCRPRVVGGRIDIRKQGL